MQKHEKLSLVVLGTAVISYVEQELILGKALKYAWTKCQFLQAMEIGGNSVTNGKLLYFLLEFLVYPHTKAPVFELSVNQRRVWFLVDLSGYGISL